MTRKLIRLAGFGAVAAALVVGTGCEGASVTGPEVAAVRAGADSQPRDSRYLLAYPADSRAVAERPDFSRYTLAYPAD